MSKSKVTKNKAKAKRKSAAPRRSGSAAPADERETALVPDDRVLASNLMLHQLFQQQTAKMLERADLSEEQKQGLLIGMSCPCCGAGGFSFTAKLRKGS